MSPVIPPDEWQQSVILEMPKTVDIDEAIDRMMARDESDGLRCGCIHTTQLNRCHVELIGSLCPVEDSDRWGN
jgi:hypothetical protein